MAVNLLGDLRAEADENMLKVAFCQTPDYKSLLESSDRSVVVGRRGTGKSALVFGLAQHWSGRKDCRVIRVAPNEDQMIGFRATMRCFGGKFEILRAGAKLLWRYGLAMEILSSLSSHYRFSKTHMGEPIKARMKTWSHGGRDPLMRLCSFARAVTAGLGSEPERIVGELAERMNLHDIEDALSEAATTVKSTVVILIDRLDEGFLPDDLGIAMVAGLMHAVVELNARMFLVRTSLFLRDNIFRAVARNDPDFSRNIEGQVLRLHWDENQLLHLVANRLAIARGLASDDAPKKIWKRCTLGALAESDGFKQCLRLTLYRPRDVVSLLNNAFHSASKNGRDKIMDADVEETAGWISEQRLEDLHKEYRNVFPSLAVLTDAFHWQATTLERAAVLGLLKKALEQIKSPDVAEEDGVLLGEPAHALDALFGVGFLGIADAGKHTGRFCHDGRKGSEDSTTARSLMVHPCYWRALQSRMSDNESLEAVEIFDEYDEGARPEVPLVKAQNLGKLIDSLGAIAEGQKGAHAFEKWCLDAIKVLFAGHLADAALHPNKDSTQRRDVVATNVADSGPWKRLYEDHRSRQVVFEVKNFSRLSSDEYRQMISYLHGPYGDVGFIINRADTHELARGPELDWVKESYHSHKKLIVKLTGKLLSSWLSKVRNPEKRQYPNQQLESLLTRYVRNYVSGKSNRR